jgi:tetratricopeptide (TPR) repeat protein
MRVKQKKTIIVHKLFYSLIILLLLSGPGFSQKLNPREIKLAESMQRSGNYEAALLIFQRHYKGGNNSPKVINGISRSLQGLNKFPEMIAFLKKAVKNHPQNFNYQIDLGKAYFLNKEEGLAYQAWQKVYQVEPPNLMRYRLTAQAMTNLRLFDEAIEVYKQIIKKLPNQDAVHLNIGTLYKYQLNYEKATEHYITYFRKFKKQQNYVRSMLISMAKDDDASDRIISALVLLNDNNDPDINELLANLYIRKKDYAQAFEIILEIEKKSPVGTFAYLERFAREAKKDNAFPYMIKAYEYILKNSKKPIIANIEFKLAMAYREEGKALFKNHRFTVADKSIKKALSILKRLYDFNTHEKQRAAESIADIYKTHFGDFDQANTYYNKIQLDKIGLNNADRVRLKMAEIALLKNDLTGARKIYSQIKSKKYLSLAAYKQAEILYFSGQFSKAKTAYNKLLSAIGMRDSLSNNTLGRTFEIDEFAGDSLTFADYSHAALLKKQQKYSEAAKQFNEIYSAKNNLSLRAGMQAVKLLLKLEKDLEAKTLLENIIMEFPEEQETGEAYFILATNYRKTGNLDKALALFQDLLVRFPTSFYTERARENARAINTRLQEKATP